VFVRNYAGNYTFTVVKFENVPCVGKKDKGEAIPLQAWTGPEGARSLRLPDFKTVGT
jgi:hypothetical protein